MTDANPEARPTRGVIPQRAPRRLWGTLFRKYVSLFLAVVTLALISNGLFQAWLATEEHRAALIRIQQEQADGAASKITQFIREIEGQLGWTTQLPWSASALEQRRFDGLRLLRQVPAITELTQLDANGRERLKVSRLSMDVVGSMTDQSQEPRFKEAIANKAYYGPVYFRRESEPYMALAMAGTRRDAGVSVAEVNLKFVWDVITQIRVGERGHAFVIDARGRLIAHPDISLVLRNTDMTRLAHIKAAREETQVAAADRMKVATDIKGQRVLTAHATAAPLGWTVFVELPEVEANAPLYSTLRRSILLLLAGLGLAFLAGLLLARRMVVPIRALRAGATRIGAGNLDERISVRTGDELEDLAEGFNAMAGQLQESYASLERKVAERTAELAQSVAELRALGEVSQAINSTLELETVLPTLVAKAVELSGTDAGALYVYDEHREEFDLKATHQMPPELINAIRQRQGQLGQSTVGRAAQQMLPIQIPDLSKEPTGPIKDLLLASGFNAVLALPLIGAGRVIGGLVVRRKQLGEFPQRTIDVMQTFAAQSVIALQNARLFRELEEKGRQLEVASQHKSQFLANMSHELRTPMNAILGYTELVLDGIYGELPERSKQVLDRVQLNGKHLLGLINDVLDLSKIEAGQLSLTAEDYAIGELIVGVVSTVESLAHTKGLSLAMEIEPEIPLCRGDQRRLRQVVLNLVGNAIKFTDKGEVHVSARSKGDQLLVAVRDTGPGIPEADQRRIFDEFQQADSSSTRQKGGTGLGLAISRRIVELHGGTIDVVSMMGQGSTFTVTLPLRIDEGREAA
jgi:signal transduction histidine kinase